MKSPEQIGMPANIAAIELAAESPPVDHEFVDCSGAYRGKGLPNAMSVDVEDYFQVSAFDDAISRNDWDSMPARLPRNIDRILQIFADRDTKATFFTLGWVCRKWPELIRRIADEKHEIASHGDDHRRVWTKSPRQAFEDFASTRKLLEDTSGTRVTGYRAPSFSIGPGNSWAHELLQEAGYLYSSSIFPISHDHYGFPGAPRFPFRLRSGGLLEVPLSSFRKFGRNLPCAGGGYFRLFPYWYTARAIRGINEAEQMPSIFYFHPWEIDPEQPRVDGISRVSRFRHYVNLDRFEQRLCRALDEFQWSRMDDVFLRDPS